MKACVTAGRQDDGGKLSPRRRRLITEDESLSRCDSLDSTILRFRRAMADVGRVDVCLSLPSVEHQVFHTGTPGGAHSRSSGCVKMFFNVPAEARRIKQEAGCWQTLSYQEKRHQHYQQQQPALLRSNHLYFKNSDLAFSSVIQTIFWEAVMVPSEDAKVREDSAGWKRFLCFPRR